MIDPGQRKYPYLMKGLIIDHPDQAWGSDITPIRLLRGLVFLVAVMDRYGRFVLGRELLNSLDALYCVSALKQVPGSQNPKFSTSGSNPYSQRCISN